MALRAATHFINVLDASGISKTQKDKGSGEPHSDGGGFDVTFEVPIFDFGRPRVREAEQRYMQAVNLLAERCDQCTLRGAGSLSDIRVGL